MQFRCQVCDDIWRPGHRHPLLTPGNDEGFMKMSCEGTHRYFVAETGTVEAEGKVCVVIVCTACGESKLIEHTVVGNLVVGNLLLKNKGQ